MEQETKAAASTLEEGLSPTDARPEERPTGQEVPIEQEVPPGREVQTEPGQTSPQGFLKLDPQAVKLWKIGGLLGLGWILPVGLVGGVLLWPLQGVPSWAILTAWGLIACLQWISIWWLPPRQYDCWSYRLDERMLELRHGVLWKTSVMIPMSRVQHIDVNHGPLERRFGLATLVIHTAGTQHAKHEVPHLEAATALQLRERLVEAVGIPVQ